MPIESESAAAGHQAVAFKSVTHKRFLNPHPVVLVVDDDAGTRLIYRTYLRAMGCRVVTASDGALGVAKAIRHRPDVIVMDLVMPRLDGWAAARALKQGKGTERVPIIALSGALRSRDSAHAAGCDAYLAKPCLPALLWCEIRVVLQAAGTMWGEMVTPRAEQPTK
jgi:CheY-like chemotaxis protein